MISVNHVDLSGKRVLVRADLNVPIEDGAVASAERIKAAMPTIRHALDRDAAVQVMSHLGRPQEGAAEPRYSLRPVADYLASRLDEEVHFYADWIDGVAVKRGTVAVFENVRFLRGELANDASLGRKMASLCDVFVMDAFACAHRFQASTCAVGQFAPVACSGLLLERELQALDAVLTEPERPVVSIVGGAKVADKLPVLRRLAEISDTLIVGGGIANTFLAATGNQVASSLFEPDLLDEALAIASVAKANQCRLPLPVDVAVSQSIDDADGAQLKTIEQVSGGDMIFDIGASTIKRYSECLRDAGTILWNGPVGVFERPAFSEGTRAMADAVAASSAYSVAGGGDTLAALDRFGRIDDISYVSTGGGAFLDYVQGKPLPAVDMLKDVQARHGSRLASGASS